MAGNLEESSMDFRGIAKLLDLNPESQDGDCSEIEWMGLGNGFGIGEWNCKLQFNPYEAFPRGPIDYKPCNYESHKTCPVYHKYHGDVESSG
tara:strand:+ start:63 stop:338 length:276 start_codon:yes stop_codon:yes gene_type:complete